MAPARQQRSEWAAGLVVTTTCLDQDEKAKIKYDVVAAGGRYASHRPRTLSAGRVLPPATPLLLHALQVFTKSEQTHNSPCDARQCQQRLTEAACGN